MNDYERLKVEVAKGEELNKKNLKRLIDAMQDKAQGVLEKIEKEDENDLISRGWYRGYQFGLSMLFELLKQFKDSKKETTYEVYALYGDCDLVVCDTLDEAIKMAKGWSMEYIDTDFTITKVEREYGVKKFRNGGEVA